MGISAGKRRQQLKRIGRAPLRAAYIAVFAPLSLVCRLLGSLVPKRENLVLFVPRFGAQFEGNVKYQFLRTRELGKEDGIDARYVVSSWRLFDELSQNGLPVLRYPRPSAIVALLRARAAVVDSSEWTRGLRSALLSGSRLVQLWHGAGLKRVAMNNPTHLERRSNPLARILWAIDRKFPTYDAMVFGSRAQLERRGGSFRFREPLIAGNPRNDVLQGAGLEGMYVGADAKAIEQVQQARERGHRVVLIAPTWRPAGSRQVTEVLDSARLHEFASGHNLVFVFKFHPKDAGRLGTGDRVIEYDAGADVYPFFRHTDCMVTDYSSIYTDYLLSGKPVIFLPYDREEYLDVRGLEYDYDEVTPGPKCYSVEDLEAELVRLFERGQDPWVAERSSVAARFFEHDDARAGLRINDYIRHTFLCPK